MTPDTVLNPGTYRIQVAQPAPSYTQYDLVAHLDGETAVIGKLDTASTALVRIARHNVAFTLESAEGEDAARCEVAMAPIPEALLGLLFEAYFLLRYPRASRARGLNSKGIGCVQRLISRTPDTATDDDATSACPDIDIALGPGDRLLPGARSRIADVLERTGADGVTWDFRAPVQGGMALRAASSTVLQDETDELTRHSAFRPGKAGHKGRLTHLPETLGEGPDRALLRTQRVPASQTGVSIILPTRDRPELLANCLKSVRASLRPQDQLIIVDHATEDPAASALIEQARTDGACVVRQDGPFNFSRLVNAGAAQARCEHLILLNNDVSGMNTDWLDIMSGWLDRPSSGVVGVDLRYPDGKRQHVGMALNTVGFPVHIDVGLSDAGPRALYAHPRDCFAVTGALLGIRKSVFDRVGGMDESYPHDFNDTLLCRTVAAQGLRVIWTPDIRATHQESASRGSPGADADLIEEWRRAQIALGEIAQRDPDFPERADKRSGSWRLNLTPLP